MSKRCAVINEGGYHAKVSEIKVEKTAWTEKQLIAAFLPQIGMAVFPDPS